MARLVYKQWKGGFWNGRDEEVEVPFVEGIVIQAKGSSYTPTPGMSGRVDSIVLTIDTTNQKFILETGFRINVGERVRIHCFMGSVPYSEPVSPNGFEVLGNDDRVIFGPVLLAGPKYYWVDNNS